MSGKQIDPDNIRLGPGGPSFQSTHRIPPGKKEWNHLESVVRSTRKIQPGDLDKWIDAALSFHYPISDLDGTDCGNLIGLLCAAVGVRTEGLAGQLCQLIVIVSIKQHALYVGESLDTIIAFLLAFIKRLLPTDLARSKLAERTPAFDSKGSAGSESWLLVDAVRALGYVLFENGVQSHSHHTKIISTLLPLSQPSIWIELRRKSIAALGNMAVKCGTRLSSFLKNFWEVLYSNYEQTVGSAHTEPDLVKLIVVILKAMVQVIGESKQVHARALPLMIRSLHRLCFFSTPYFPVSSAQPSRAVTGNVSSDSEIDGDSDISGPMARKTKSVTARKGANPLSRVRLAALSLVHAIARVSPKLMHDHWRFFMPDKPSPASSSLPRAWQWANDPHAPVSLLTLILHDADPRVRATAAGALGSLFDGSAQLLATAEESIGKRQVSFTSLSQSLAAMIHESHVGLFAALESETQVSTTVQLLRCLTALIQNAPYSRLLPGLCSDIVRKLLKSDFLDQKSELGSKIACLNCLAGCLSTRTSLPEIEELLWDSSLDGVELNPMAHPFTNWDPSCDLL